MNVNFIDQKNLFQKGRGKRKQTKNKSPSIVLLAQALVHLAEDDSEFALLALGETEWEAAVGESVVADGGNVSFLPGERDPVVFVDVDEGLKL